MDQDPKTDFIHLDFEQARARHLFFKSKLRSILYGVEIDETPVASHYECAVGKWIYSHALTDYGYIPEMHELEKVHADIHTSARELIRLYKNGNVEEARKGLEGMEKIADKLVTLLSLVENKIKENPSLELINKDYKHVLEINLKELYELQNANYELDIRMKEQSKALFNEKERFELVANATHDAVWDWDLLTNSLWWNTGFKELFGFKDNDIEPGIESWYNRIHAEDRDRIVKSIHDAIDNGGRQWSDEYRFLRADGSYAFIYDRGYALHDEKGKPFRMVGSMQDQSAKKLVEEELEKKVQERTIELREVNQKLERSNAELEQFAYVTSHDLQEPLRKIQVFNNMVLERFSEDLNDIVKSYLGKVTESAKRMSGLINDLLDYSRVSHTAVQFEEVDLNEILKNVLKDLEVLITQKKGVVQSDLLDVIEAIPLQMNQLFYNLISNALKFVRKGLAPLITITASKLTQEKKRLYAQLNADKDYYEIKFQDNGIGFNQEYANKIFTIFQRLNERSKFSGYGIGLSICSKVVSNHQGIIFAEGKEQEGAIFTVIVPIKQ